MRPCAPAKCSDRAPLATAPAPSAARSCSAAIASNSRSNAWGSSAIRLFEKSSVIVAIATINPSTAQTVRTFDELTDAQIDDKLRLAADAFRRFRRTSITARAEMMLRAASILESEADALGRVMTLEMGKLAKAGRDEALKCAWGCRFYAEHTAHLLADLPIATNAAESFVRY